ncbi:MAG: TetR/AcrR family transcriptional regulator [Planctomycetota bacterium]|nr:MAG: TetR/AcrR family transcriptional regulator [Planctomycetota bacterium]
MPRPSQTRERRRKLMPVVARTFAELGYRRTTTAELARRCKVQENILYRLWMDKKAMFIAAIEYVYERSAEIWGQLLREGDKGGSSAEVLLAYESKHHGEFGLYRIVFAGISEFDDPDIREAMASMYQLFQKFIQQQITAHRKGRKSSLPDPALSAWAIVGLGTVANISRELDLITDRKRRNLIANIGRVMLDGTVR